MQTELAGRKPFKNSTGSLYGLMVKPGLYVVYSYGEHWPLAVWTQEMGWWVNDDKVSQTTTRHRADVRKALDYKAEHSTLRGLQAMIDSFTECPGGQLF